MKKVAVLTTGHPPDDDRILYKISSSLKSFGYSVRIICSTRSIHDIKDGIEIRGIETPKQQKRITQKIHFFVNELKQFKPDHVICEEPVPVVISFLYKILHFENIKIIYDITEWYPENIAYKKNGLKKTLIMIFGHLINFIATHLANYLFIGEEWKIKRYRIYAPRKKFSLVPYYPVVKYYNFSPPKLISNKIIFGYAGVISISRGLDIFYELLKSLQQKLSATIKIKFKLAGRFENESEKDYLSKFNLLNINFEYFEWTEYKSFSAILDDVHICLDLRHRNGIYERSLPIKIFDYMALGKCIIASNFEPIKTIFQIAKCGILVNPENLDDIIEKTIDLIMHPGLIQQYGINGRDSVEKFFNWSICEIEIKRALEYLENSK